MWNVYRNCTFFRSIKSSCNFVSKDIDTFVTSLTNTDLQVLPYMVHGRVHVTRLFNFLCYVFWFACICCVLCRIDNTDTLATLSTQHTGHRQTKLIETQHNTETKKISNTGPTKSRRWIHILAEPVFIYYVKVH